MVVFGCTVIFSVNQVIGWEGWVL